MSGVVTLSLTPTPFNRREILRYSGVKVADAAINELLDSCLAEAADVFQNRVCFGVWDVRREEKALSLGRLSTDSTLLHRHLQGCTQAVLFAATVGVDIDRLIRKYSRLSPSRAVMMQAIGTERIEALCDTLEGELRRRYGSITTRVSAGYGDIPLALQRDLCEMLDCPRQVGVSLNDSLLMSPSKSVTGIIGIAPATEQE